MKLIVGTLAVLLMTACTSSPDRTEGEYSKPLRESSELSGSSTQAPMVRRGNTMSDHNKLLEMCESMNIEGDCEERAMSCQGQMDAVSCLRGSNDNQ